ncbi:aldo/keto reductase [Paracoccus lutimaris]|uniref:Diketogulonate reductase-like aldo/keto reductase n=1 Tax=Paracoccus lutimaris TaxID=1490030 RepID=A0A368Z557_9RHOB|nr:aldo/keto reductase [Paracoccus lutimaris]RCW87109.1 diketogulonate reductase-like aldo/keto reductase [Paracoccus lutimaris]
MKGPVLELNNGVGMPALGLGVYRSGPEGTVAAVKAALADGYRMIDTAAAYMNEAEVGQGIRESDVPRADIFVQTKLWMSDYGRDRTLHAFDRSMRKLGLEVLDLYLLHWPVPKRFDLTVESWQAVIGLMQEGRVRAIGICNSAPDDLRRLIDATGVAPAVNQVELHPHFAQPALQKANRDLGIVTQAWSPIGGVNRYWRADAARNDPLSDQVITALATKHGKTPAQIVLRWQIQLGHSVIPKSVNPGRIHENGDIFDFALSAEDMAAINSLDRGERGGPDPAEVTPEAFAISIED